MPTSTALPSTIKHWVLLLPLVVNALCVPALCQVDVPIQEHTPYLLLARNVSWGVKGTGGIENNYIFAPYQPDQGVCIDVLNSNPTSAHTLQIGAAQATDPAVVNFSSIGGSNGHLNVSGWSQLNVFFTGGVTTNASGNAAPGNINSVNIPATTFGQFYVRSSGAARIVISIFGTSTAAGSPDTAQITISQLIQGGNCGTASISPGIGVGAASLTEQLTGTLAVGNGGEFISQPVVNIGQSQHSVTCQFSTVGVVFLILQASYDNVTYFGLTPPSNASNGDNSGNNWEQIEAYGAYPFVRLRLHNSSGGTITINQCGYGGIIYPNSDLASVSPGYKSRGMIQQVFCTAGANTLTNASATLFFIAVYGYQVSCQTTTASNWSIVATSGTKAEGGCIQTGPTIAPVNGALPYFVTNRGDNLTITVPTTGCVGIQYRYEDNQ